MTLIDYIPFGRSNAIQAKALAKAAGFPDVRTLQQAIHSLRVQGVLILSSTQEPQGYFLPEPGEDYEVSKFLNSMRSRVREIEAAARPAEIFLNAAGYMETGSDGD